MFELQSVYFSVSFVFVRAGVQIQANPHLPDSDNTRAD